MMSTIDRRHVLGTCCTPLRNTRRASVVEIQQTLWAPTDAKSVYTTHKVNGSFAGYYCTTVLIVQITLQYLCSSQESIES